RSAGRSFIWFARQNWSIVGYNAWGFTGFVMMRFPGRWRRSIPAQALLLVVETGSDTQWRKIVRPAQHHSGNAAVVDTGWIRRGREILGVSAKVTRNPDQLRVIDDLCPRHNR